MKIYVLICIPDSPQLVKSTFPRKLEAQCFLIYKRNE